jgi:hypothetical protein
MEKRSKNAQITERMFDDVHILYNRRKAAKLLCLSFSA